LGKAHSFRDRTSFLIGIDFIVVHGRDVTDLIRVGLLILGVEGQSLSLSGCNVLKSIDDFDKENKDSKKNVSFPRIIPCN